MSSAAMMMPSTSGGMTMNEWIYAQLIVSVQGVLVLALISQPLNMLMTFLSNLIRTIVNASGAICPIEISATMSDPGQESVSVECRMIQYLMSNALYTSSRASKGKIIPEGWLISRKGFGHMMISVAHVARLQDGSGATSVTFSGHLFPIARRHFESLHRAQANHLAYDSKTESSSKSSICLVEKPNIYIDTLQVVWQKIPDYVLRSQQRAIDQLKSEFEFVCSKPSLRGNNSQAVLLIGPPGCGKTIMVNQLVKQIDGILLKVASITDGSIGQLRSTIRTVRNTQDVGNMVQIYQKSYDSIKRSKPIPSKEGKQKPIVILIDEFDSVISSSIPKIPDRCLQKMQQDGMTGQDLSDAMEELQEQLANTPGCAETSKTKSIVNAFMDYLTTLDNVIVVFISNTDMRQVNASFVRDGRITSRIKMSTLTLVDVLDFTSVVAEQRGWNKTEAIDKITSAMSPTVTPSMHDKDSSSSSSSPLTDGLRKRHPVASSEVDISDPLLEEIPASVFERDPKLLIVPSCSDLSHGKSNVLMKLDETMARHYAEAKESQTQPLTIATVVQILDSAKSIDDAATKFTEALKLIADREAKLVRKKKLTTVADYLKLCEPVSTATV
jgi:Cdc6-like AAA superfamily ATPase